MKNVENTGYNDTVIDDGGETTPGGSDDSEEPNDDDSAMRNFHFLSISFVAIGFWSIFWFF